MPGKYFEELEVGLTFRHEPSRTVTETDNLLFTTLTMNPQPLHLDAEFAAEQQYGKILVNSIFTLGLIVGLSVGDTTLGTTIGNLGFEETTFPAPVFIGDTIVGEVEVLKVRATKPVTQLRVEVRRGEGEVVLKGEAWCYTFPGPETAQ